MSSITRSRKAQLSLYEQLCFYIDEHLSEDLSLERLAAELFVSKYHIAHVFKDEIGISIHQYISKKRLARCREALLGDVPVTKVYLLFGFQATIRVFTARLKVRDLAEGF